LTKPTRRFPFSGWLLILLIGGVLSFQPVRWANAEVVVDNTLVTVTDSTLTGPDYQITPDLGRQIGANQFYSFETFNIKEAESATFSGPPAINAIISRVTGPEPSRIEGSLRSIIPGADFYFVNPKGIIWGKNAHADISGSLFMGTADYIQFEEGERFHTLPVEGELLSSEPPIAFGFLGNAPASIRFEGTGEISPQEMEERHAAIETPSGRAISIMAGDIFCEKGSYAISENTLTAASQLSAPQGEIHLTAVQAGEVSLEDGALVDAGAARLGTVIFDEHSRIESDEGEIHIRGEKLILEKSAIEAHSGFIEIDMKQEVFLQNGLITANSLQSEFDAGQIEISSELISISSSQILANADAGKGGSIRMNAGAYDSSSDTLVQANSLSGEPGSVKITFRSDLPISDEAADAVRDQISSAAGTDTASSPGGEDSSGGDEGEESESDGDAAKAAASVGKIRESQKWMAKDCSARIGQKVSRVSVESRDAYPTDINDWQASPPVVIEATENPAALISGAPGTKGPKTPTIERGIDNNCPCPAID
jgi:filamentous hemagglutinin family protein